MRKFYKKLTALGLAALMCIPMAACGGKKETNTSGKATKAYVYVPEYQALTEQSDVSSIAISKNTIYYTVWDYDETTGTSSNAIKAMEIGSTEGQALPVQLGENDSVSSFYADKDGNLVMVISTYTQVGNPEGENPEGENPEEENLEGENPEDYTQSYTLKKFDKDGNELFASDLTQLMNEVEDFYIQNANIDGEGNIYLSNGENKIWILDGQGNELGTIDIQDYIYSMGTTKEGKVVVATYSADKNVLQEIDLASKSLGQTYENVPPLNGSYTIMPGIDKGCLISSGNSLYEYDFKSQSSEEILNWIDSDIDSDNVIAVSPLEDGRILALTRNYTEENSATEMVYLTKKASSEVVQKTIITYGTLYMSSRVRSEIIDFNKTNETYRIQPKEYGNDDYEAGMAQMNSDIVSGNSPDIIDLSSGNIQQYIEKGILDDLYAYLDKDSELKKEDYVDNILKAYEQEGKLYAVLPAFGITTVIGKTSDVGDKMGWTIDQLIALVDSKPEGTEVFEYASKDMILTVLCMYGMDQFVDWETGKCSFDNDTFVKMLEFTNTFKSEFTYDENEPSEAAKIQSGQLLLSMASIGDVTTYQMQEMMFGEPITCVGYPTDSGTGSAITPGEVLLGISAKSANKEGAWEFVRRFLTPEYQNSSDLWSFPILKSALQAKFDEAMKKTYYEDENGNKVEEMKTSWGYDEVNFDIYAATQEQIDSITNLINSVDAVQQYDEEMYKIISEESAAFFAGQKTAQDVANVIQSRVQIYVNENR
jgi:ABC-type glycerol-3-phosphate transport system substrate-binding protein